MIDCHRRSISRQTPPEQNEATFEYSDHSRVLLTPWSIKGKSIQNRLLLAPMAGLGHIAFRELIAGFGGFGLLFTGMCSAKAVPTENRHVSTVFTWRDEELPWTVCQLFGATPKSMAKAAKRVEKENFFGVDINFGCCAAAICKQGSGAALLKTPDKAVDIVKAVRDAVDIPLFVKFRTGWDSAPDQSARLAASFEKAGADALVFHPRVAPDRRARPPKWRHICHVKEAVSIPVFGNGNIFDASDCEKMMAQSHCNGISIGRMAVARPWIFADLIHHISLNKSAEALPRSTFIAHQADIKQTGWPAFLSPQRPCSSMPINMSASPNIYHYSATRLLFLLLKYHDAQTTVRMFKKTIPYFAAGFKFGLSISKQLLKGSTVDELQRLIDTTLDPLPETVERPNLHLFS